MASISLGQNSLARNILLINHRAFAILVMLSPLYLFKNPAIKLVGYGCLICIFGLCVYDLVCRFNSINGSRLWMWFFVFCSYSTVTLVRNPTTMAIYSFALQNGLLLFMCLLSSIHFAPVAI